MQKISIVIPAYNPDYKLLQLITSLVQTNVGAIIVVNDGSDARCDAIFHRVEKYPKVTVLQHATNLGKGGALKMGLNHVYVHFPEHIGVVTADADGQHNVRDILEIVQSFEQHQDHLVVGVRRFDQKTPWRSKLGNALTIWFYRLMVGQKLTDTQSGLRGIPRALIPKLLTIKTNGYEFEMDMLLACKYQNISLHEEAIETIYIENNKGSHFNPLSDSVRIYFELFRSTIFSFLSAVIDNIVFIVGYFFGFNILMSQCMARLISGNFNYLMFKKWVFYCDQSVRVTLPKYVILLIMSGGLSYGVINYLIYAFPVKVITAKIIAEVIIYLANFAIQRDFIFTRRT